MRTIAIFFTEYSFQGGNSMIISQKAEESLNRLLQKLFGGNARIDNLYYNLQYKHLNKLADAIHEPVAHQLPEWADNVSDLIDHLGGRPKRYGAPDYTQEYQSAKEVFLDLKEYFAELQDIVKKNIDELELSDDFEVRIFLEDFLLKTVTPYSKQAEEWYNASEMLDENSFNIHIEDYTHYIKQ